MLVLCGGDNKSVKEVFKQYERLKRISGLELNAVVKIAAKSVAGITVLTLKRLSHPLI